MLIIGTIYMDMKFFKNLIGGYNFEIMLVLHIKHCELSLPIVPVCLLGFLEVNLVDFVRSKQYLMANHAMKQGL